MSNTVIFLVGSCVFALTVFGAVMAGGVTLTRHFYEENHAYTARPGFDKAGLGAPKPESHADGSGQSG